jgi:hypothetical protein
MSELRICSSVGILTLHYYGFLATSTFPLIPFVLILYELFEFTASTSTLPDLKHPQTPVPISRQRRFFDYEDIDVLNREGQISGFFCSRS